MCSARRAAGRGRGDPERRSPSTLPDDSRRMSSDVASPGPSAAPGPGLPEASQSPVLERVRRGTGAAGARHSLCRRYSQAAAAVPARLRPATWALPGVRRHLPAAMLVVPCAAPRSLLAWKASHEPACALLAPMHVRLCRASSLQWPLPPFKAPATVAITRVTGSRPELGFTKQPLPPPCGLGSCCAARMTCRQRVRPACSRAQDEGCCGRGRACQGRRARDREQRVHLARCRLRPQALRQLHKQNERPARHVPCAGLRLQGAGGGPAETAMQSPLSRPLACPRAARRARLPRCGHRDGPRTAAALPRTGLAARQATLTYPNPHQL
jgi:hypothetical protein